MSTSTESSFISMQYVVRIVLMVTILFGILLVVDPPFSTLGIVPAMVCISSCALATFDSNSSDSLS